MLASVLQTWYELAGVIIAVPVALALVWAVVKIVRHLLLVHEAIIGRPATAFSDPIPSMIERFHLVNLHLESQDETIEAIKDEFRTNGGASVKDDLKRLQRTVDALGG